MDGFPHLAAALAMAAGAGRAGGLRRPSCGRGFAGARDRAKPLRPGKPRSGMEARFGAEPGDTGRLLRGRLGTDRPNAGWGASAGRNDPCGTKRHDRRAAGLQELLHLLWNKLRHLWASDGLRWTLGHLQEYWQTLYAFVQHYDRGLFLRRWLWRAGASAEAPRRVGISAVFYIFRSVLRVPADRGAAALCLFAAAVPIHGGGAVRGEHRGMLAAGVWRARLPRAAEGRVGNGTRERFHIGRNVPFHGF